MDEILKVLDYLNLVPASSDAGNLSIFGISEFLTATALLLVVYTISTERVKFRLNTALLPVRLMAFWYAVFAAISMFLIEHWFANKYQLPKIMNDKPLLQTIIAFVFLALIFYWMYVAFISPPKFGWFTCRRYFNVVSRAIATGDKEELVAIAIEIERSVPNIIKHASRLQMVEKNSDEKIPRLVRYGNDFLLLLANKRFCKFVVDQSPLTAYWLISEVSTKETFGVPIGVFVRNVSKALISNKSSVIYDEDHFSESGWSGHVKPFTTVIYGDHNLVTALGSNFQSPLDVFDEDWDHIQFRKLCGVSLVFVNSWFEKHKAGENSYVLNRLLGDVERASDGIYKVNGKDDSLWESDEYQKLGEVVDFIKKFVKILDDREIKPVGQLKPERKHLGNIQNKLAHMILAVIKNSASVTEPVDTCWSVQHNGVWSSLFGFEDSCNWKVIKYKVRRLLYDDILRLDQYANFGNARTLGYCLNVLGLHETRFRHHQLEFASLRLPVLSWTKKNFLKLMRDYPNVAEACMHGSVTFDAENRQLVKTFSGRINKVPDREYLELDAVDDKG